jgi:hypothetical protein
MARRQTADAFVSARPHARWPVVLLWLCLTGNAYAIAQTVTAHISFDPAATRSAATARILEGKTEISSAEIEQLKLIAANQALLELEPRLA